MKEKNMEIRRQAQLTLIIILILVSLPGCSQKTDKLAGTEWELVTLKGKELIEGTAITLNFTDEYLGGQMGCNGYGGTQDSGKYHAKSDGTFTLGSPFAVTVQLCADPEGIMEQEKTYIEALMNAIHFQMVDNRLEFENKAGKTILIFKAINTAADD